MRGHSCCVKQKLKKGLWSPEEDEKLFNHITKFGVGCWSSVPKHADSCVSDEPERLLETNPIEQSADITSSDTVCDSFLLGYQSSIIDPFGYGSNFSAPCEQGPGLGDPSRRYEDEANPDFGLSSSLQVLTNLGEAQQSSSSNGSIINGDHRFETKTMNSATASDPNFSWENRAKSSLFLKVIQWQKGRFHNHRTVSLSENLPGESYFFHEN